MKGSQRRRLQVLGSVCLAFLLVALGFSDSLYRAYYRVNYLPGILQACAEHTVDPHTVAAIIFVESRFRPEASSQVGAMGLMQLMPETARDLAQRHALSYSDKRLLEPGYNINLGTAYYAELCARFPREEQALAAYNAGPTIVGSWSQEEPPPYPETRRFVEEVRTHRRQLERLYPEWDGMLDRYSKTELESDQNPN